MCGDHHEVIWDGRFSVGRTSETESILRPMQSRNPSIPDRSQRLERLMCGDHHEVIWSAQILGPSGSRTGAIVVSGNRKESTTSR